MNNKDFGDILNEVTEGLGMECVLAMSAGSEEIGEDTDEGFFCLVWFGLVTVEIRVIHRV